MTKAIILLFSVLCTISANAQYYNSKTEKAACYVTTDLKKKKTLRDTLYITDVVDKGDRLIIKEDAFGDSHSPQSILDGANITFYIYYKDQDITEVILLDGTSENETIKKDIYSRYLPSQQKEAEEEYKSYIKYMHSDGRISFPLKDNATMGEDIPPCNYLQKIGPMTMKASLKGQYKGREIIHTPVGDFDCIKVYTESKGKIMFVSETEYAIDWYAKDIGLVKSETITKKGKVLTSTILNGFIDKSTKRTAN